MVYTLPTGESCRTFDDVLTLSAQRWAALRDELTSGRLAAALARTGRGNLAPDPNAPGSADERLDAWLRSLPTKKPCQPELEVHPEMVEVRNRSGGVIRRRVRVINTGYGLLTYRVKIDADLNVWLRVEGGSDLLRSVVETGDFTLEIDLPEDTTQGCKGSCTVESNGGEVGIPVFVDAVVANEDISRGVPGEAEPVAAGLGLASWPLLKRLGILVPLVLVARLLEGVSTSVLAGDSGVSWPLWPAAATFSVVGMMLGTWWTRRGLSVVDRVAVGFSGAVAGLIASTVVVALTRTLESPLPELGFVRVGLVGVLWLVVGLCLAWGSMWAVPAREAKT